MSILRVNSITPYTGSLLTINGDIVITGNFTGSSIGDVGTRLTNLESETIALESFTSSFSTSVTARLDIVEATASLYAPFSTSVDSRLDIVEATASLHIPFSTSVDSRLDIVEATASLHIPFSTSVTARFAGSATTGSNTFIGNQTISGSILVNGNINANSLTGSINYNNLTNIPAVIVSEGIVSGSSQITISSTTGFTDYSGSVATSISASSAAATAAATWTSLSGKPEGIVSGSSQITYSDITGIPTGIISSSNQLTASYDGRYVLSGSITQTTWDNIASKPDGIVSGSSQVNADSVTNFDENVKAKLDADSVVSGSLLGLLPTGVVSGSSQVNADSVTNFDENVKAKLDADSVVSGSLLGLLPTGVVSGSAQIIYADITSIPSGIVSSSSQITISSTTGYSDYSSSVATSISASSAAATAAATWTSLSGKPEGIVSGSSQVNADSVTNFDENVKAKLDADSVVSGSLLGLLPTGVVSGSAQIDVTATTNYNTISSHISNTSNPHSVTANQVGLGNVTNESKATMFSSPTFTGTVSGVTATHIGLGNVTNESKATMFTDAALTGTPTAPTATANTNSTQIATTAYVQQELTDLIGGAPAAFDTLLEISASLAAGDSNLAGLVDGKLSKASNLSDLSDTSTARTNLGVAIGTNVQAYNSTLASVAGGTYSGDDSITTIGTITAGSVTPILPMGVVSGSAQISGLSNGQLTNSSITIGSTSTALGATATTLAGLTSVTSTGFTGALTGNASTATTAGALTTARTINGTSFDGSTNITIPNLVSGSSQISAGSTTGFATDVKTVLNSNTIVSGSSQVNADSVTNFDTNVKDKLNADSVVSGSLLGLLPTGVVSGSAQIVGSSITTNTVTYNGTAVALGSSATITAVNPNALTIGTGLSGTSYNGSSGVTIANTGVTSNVGGNAITVSGATGAVTINHADTSTAANLTASGRTYVSALTFDTYGHVTGYSTGTETVNDTNTTYAVGDGGLTAVNFTTTRRDKLDGIAAGANNYSFPYTVSSAEGASTVVQRDASGYIFTAYFNGSGTFATTGNTSGMGRFTGTNGSDTYGRSYTAAAARALLNVADGANNVTNTNQLTNGAGFVTGQTVATSSNVQFNSLGVGKAAPGTAGRIEATQDIVAYASSDRRFKENITPIQDALDKISKISGITFDWKAENKSEHGYEGNDVGVIAQEIEAVLPQLVQTRENGYKAVKYEKLVALLIEGIKELHNEITILKNK